MVPRRLWLRLHRWIALSLGLLLALIALLGAVLTVAQPLDRQANSALFRVPNAGPAHPELLERARARLQAEFGPGTALRFRPPRDADDTLWVLVRGPWSGTVYLEPATGRELGRRGEQEGMFNLLFELHSSLLLEDRGKALLAALALAYLVLLATGLVLWWPKHWRQAWRIKLGHGALRALFDLHRVGGAVLGLLAAVTVASGAYMAWRPLSGWVTALSGTAAVRPPAVPVSSSPRNVTLDAAVRQAQMLFPASLVGYVQIPAAAGEALRVRLKLPDDPHPNGLTSVWLHPSSGQPLAVHRWNQLDLGARAYSVVYPLHTGELGGPLHTVFNALLGLTLFGLGASGLWLWWRRSALRRS
jgi:uncharacterized iron-regulated membrane protein